MSLSPRLAAVIALSAPAIAFADPCTAPLPHRGETFSGPVTYIIDADGLCVGTGGPETWVEVRLLDFNGPELSEPDGQSAKRALQRIAQGQAVTCQVKTAPGRVRTYDRVLAVCRINGVSLGDRMRAAGIREGGR